MTRKHDTREGWLVAGMAELDKLFFAENGYELPEKLQVSCGFPRASSKAIGQCWDPKASKNKTTHMFVCPSQDDPIQVLGILLHEMIHAAVGCEVGHKGPFRKLAKEFGLAGKMTATYVEAETELWHKMRTVAGRLGDYPHAAMIKQAATKKGGGWLRYRSAREHTYTLTISPKSIDEFGPPRDPWGDEMELVTKS